MPDQDVDTIDELTVDTTIEQPDYTAVSTSPTEDELERFREEWQKELQQRKRQDPGIQIQQTAQQRSSGSLPTGSLASNNAAGTAAKTQIKDRGRTSDFDRDIKHDPPLPRKSPSTSPKLSQRLPKSPTKSAAQIEPVGGHSPSANATSSSSKTVKEVKGKRAQKVAQAVEQYANAVELEQMGRLNEALQLYRGAYRLDPQVEKAYHHWVIEQENNLLQGIEELQVTDPSRSIAASLPEPEKDVYTFRTTVQTNQDYVPVVSSVVGHPSTVQKVPETSKSGKRSATAQSSGNPTPRDQAVGDRNDPLTHILLSWLETAREDILHPVEKPTSDETASTHVSPFTPERLPETIHDLYHHLPLDPLDDKYPILLLSLPEEILDNVMEFLDVTSLERFALVCKRLRVLTRGVGKWRSLCQQLYQPPILPPEGSLQSLVKRHGMDYRTTFLEERRVRYDGVYISVCHYIRPGQSELAWVNITHLITYHRFLRFYPDGTVISLLTTDHPVDVVHNIKPSLRAKGTLFGKWTLSTLKSDPADPSSRATHPSSPTDINLISIRQMLEPGLAVPKYEFEMNLDLRSAQRGRWNKLEMRDYQSIRLGTGEALGLSLKHQKPFYFSKVRSYSNTL